MKVLKCMIILCICCLNANAQKYWVMGQILDDFTYDPIDSVTVRFLRTDSTEVERFVSKDETKRNNRSLVRVLVPQENISCIFPNEVMKIRIKQ